MSAPKEALTGDTNVCFLNYSLTLSALFFLVIIILTYLFVGFLADQWLSFNWIERLGQISWMSYSMQYFKWLAIRGALTSYQMHLWSVSPWEDFSYFAGQYVPSLGCKLTENIKERRSHWHSSGVGKKRKWRAIDATWLWDDRPVRPVTGLRDDSLFSPRWPASPYHRKHFHTHSPIWYHSNPIWYILFSPTWKIAEAKRVRDSLTEITQLVSGDAIPGTVLWAGI